jgi:hypothetical protein
MQRPALFLAFLQQMPVFRTRLTISTSSNRICLVLRMCPGPLTAVETRQQDRREQRAQQLSTGFVARNTKATMSSPATIETLSIGHAVCVPLCEHATHARRTDLVEQEAPTRPQGESCVSSYLSMSRGICAERLRGSEPCDAAPCFQYQRECSRPSTRC